MNLSKLKQAEENFFNRYPGGFDDPEMEAIKKKHKMDKMVSFVQESFAKKNFKDTDTIIENITKTVTRASVVSVFEKVKFKDFTKFLTHEEKKLMVKGLKEILHGDERKGFELFHDVLQIGKLAKWPLMTVVQNYYRPSYEVFIKPTTAKNTIQYFELEGLVYKPQPTWEFYEKYRETINEMKKNVDPTFTKYNAGFCGFLMMSV